MKLFHCKDARSLRALWALEELELDYELEVMPFPPRSRRPGYLEINALGTVPTLVDGGAVLTESSGICHYLAERNAPTPLRIAPAEPGYDAYINWLFRSDATLTFPLTLVLRYTHLEPEARRNAQVAEDYLVWFLSRLRSVESALEDGRDFLVADRFTMADIAVHYALYFGRNLGIQERYKPNCLRYLDLHMERAAFRRALEKQSG